MPPKRQASVSSIAINSISTNKFRSNAATDLITKSQTALSSQASVLQKTQNSQASQKTNFNFAMPDNDDIQFNRQEMGEVQISKEEQEMIQKILEVARKGKINSKNAFEIPIKVVSSEMSFSANNRFWKFASELLSASMSIYDKRVENMYLSAGAFENKLSRIGFDIKSRKERERDDQQIDDVHADEDSKARRNRQERHDILKISVEDFSGALNLQDQSIIGFQTLDKKDKLDIKNVENKFIADPTFERTQKMFDSFSLKSLMLNIFELSTELDVRIFMKSDLEWQKLREDERQRTQQNIELDKPQQNEEEKQPSDNASVNSKTQTNKSLADFQALNEKSGEEALPFYLLKHINASKNLLENNNFLEEIQSFIIQQPELKEDYLKRKINSKKPNKMQVEEEPSQNIEDLTYGEIIQRERNQFSEIMKQFHGSYDQDIGGHHFAEIQNGEGLYETENISQSQFENSQPLLFSQSYINRSLAADTEANSMPSMSVSFQQNFYAWDERNNIIEPIMPWQIQFKNLELTKKIKKGTKNIKKEGKKNSKKARIPNIDFQLSILDRKEVLAQKDTKKKFESQKIVSKKMNEMNTVNKQFDIVHSEYHIRFNNGFLNSRNTIIKSQQVHANQKQQLGINDGQSFILDLDQSMMEPSFGQKKGDHDQHNNFDQETRALQPENYQKNNEISIIMSGQKMTKNTSYAGLQMGVNNIREVKALIVSEINEKGKTTLDFMNQMLVNLSPQQLFTIFLHLTNEYQYEIYNEDDEQTKIVLRKAVRGRNNRGQERMGNVEDVEI